MQPLALECLAHHLWRIKPSSKCADIRQSFQAKKQALSGSFAYEHVYGYMDNYLLWHQLTLLKQQLNCICDTLTKREIKMAIRQGYQDTPTQILPKEDVALVIKGNKIMWSSRRKSVIVDALKSEQAKKDKLINVQLRRLEVVVVIFLNLWAHRLY